MSSAQQIPKAVDIAQASQMTGLSEDALRSYVEQGALDSIDVGGTRMIPVSELASHKLLQTPAALDEASGSPTVAQPEPPSEVVTPSAPAPSIPEQDGTPSAGAAPPPPPPTSEQGAPSPAAPEPPSATPAASAPPANQPPTPPTMVAPVYPPGQYPPPPPGYPYPGAYPERGGLSTWYQYPALRWLLVLLLLALIGLVVWLLAFRSDDSGTPTVERGGGPVGVTQEDLVALSQQIHQPIYWAGTMPGTRMELTETDSSYAYIRYLTEDASVGDASANYLTVGTYPALNAYQNLRDYASNSRAKLRPIQDGGAAVVIPGSPTSVYFAYPHVDVQVEVYDPQPQRALDLVKSGVVRPVTASTSTTSAAPATGTPPSVTVPTTATTTPDVTPVAPPGG